MVIESGIFVQLTFERLGLDLNLRLPHKRGDITIYTTSVPRSREKKRMNKH